MGQKRFEAIVSQGTVEQMRIIKDTVTGVHYFYVSSGMSGGLTVLVDQEGKPITNLEE